MYRTRPAAQSRWGRTVLIAVVAFLAGVVAVVAMAGYVSRRRTQDAVKARDEADVSDSGNASEETDR